MRFSSTEADNVSELGVFAARVGSTLEIGAATELVTVGEVGGCGSLDEVVLDGTNEPAFTDTSTLEIDCSLFELPAVGVGRGFGFGVIDTVNDGSINQFDDSDTVHGEP